MVCGTALRPPVWYGIQLPRAIHLKYLLVMLGGGAGSLARYLAGTLITRRLGSLFPVGTLLVNVTGSFLIGLLMTLLTERLPHPNWRLLLVVGRSAWRRKSLGLRSHS